MQVRRLAVVAVLPLILGTGLAACDKEAGAGGTALVVSVGLSEPQHLVPSNTDDNSGGQVLTALFTPLVTFDREYKPVETEVAAAISTSDNRVWTIKLRDGYTFHNGETVTARSYIDAWNAGAYGPNAQNSAQFYSKIDGFDQVNAPTSTTRQLKGLQQVDDLTFTVTLRDPFVNFKSMLRYTAFYPLPKAAFSGEATYNKDFENAPIGQGPFKMAGTWQHDQAVEVTRYDGYKGTKPRIGGVKFKIYQSATEQYKDLLAGTLDVVPTIPTENTRTARADLGDRYRQSANSEFQFLAFPLFDARYGKPDVRKAISMAIDRDQQVKTVFGGSQRPAQAFVSPVLDGYRADACGEACTYNPARAKELLKQAGGIPGNKIQISYNADGAHKDWIDATCGQLRTNLGLTCTANPVPKFADLKQQAQNRKQIGMFRLGWSMDYPAMENYLSPLYACKGSSNYYGYCNPAFDKLVAHGDKAENPEAAVKLFQQAEDLLAKDLPVVPLRFGQNNFGHSTKVRSVEMDLYSFVDVPKIEPA